MSNNCHVGKQLYIRATTIAPKAPAYAMRDTSRAEAAPGSLVEEGWDEPEPVALALVTVVKPVLLLPGVVVAEVVVVALGVIADWASAAESVMYLVRVKVDVRVVVASSSPSAKTKAGRAARMIFDRRMAAVICLLLQVKMWLYEQVENALSCRLCSKKIQSRIPNSLAGCLLISKDQIDGLGDRW